MFNISNESISNFVYSESDDIQQSQKTNYHEVVVPVEFSFYVEPNYVIYLFHILDLFNEVQ